MRLTRRRFLLAPAVLAPALLWSPGAAAKPKAKPLWEGARYSAADKARAIRRGLDFVYRTAKEPKHFAEYGSDYLLCLATIASATSDRDLKARAHKLAMERGREWRRIHPNVPDGIDADEVADLVFGALAA